MSRSRIAPALLIFLGTAITSQTQAKLQLNESKLWYGTGQGIETVFRTGKNLAYTVEDEKIDARMTRKARGFEQALVRVGGRAYVAYGWALTNTTMVVGNDGVIIIDPPDSTEPGPEIFAAFRTVTNLPVRAIVYTQGRFANVAAVKAFATEEEVNSGQVDIYAHESFMKSFFDRASVTGPIEVRRNAYTVASYLPAGPDGPVHSALGPTARAGSVGFIPPTKTFSDSLDVEVAGLNMRLTYVPSGTNGEIAAWFPDEKILHSAGILQGENFPVLGANCGAQYCDPMSWVKGIDTIRAYQARYLVPSHGRPVGGAENVSDVLTAYRDAIQFVHDQTIRYMNDGYTPDQLVEAVVLPPHLAEHPWINEDYGTVKEAVRYMYHSYLGWFQADPWMLDPLPYMERASRTVRLMGGRDAVVDAARQAVDAAEYTWAAELLTPVIRLDKNDMVARELKARAYREWATTVANVTWRNWGLTAAAELEGELPSTGGVTPAPEGVVHSFDSDALLQVLATRLDPERSRDAHMTLGIRFTGADTVVGMELRRGILQIHPQLSSTPDAIMVVEREVINRLLVSDVPLWSEMSPAMARGPDQRTQAIMAAIENGEIEIEAGPPQLVERFFTCFDRPVDPGSIHLVVR
jgi:alkyl sulfatase BDS1-like metallo-beta-lactamase superfamily hydrolase